MGQALQKFDVRTTFALQRDRSLRAQQVQPAACRSARANGGGRSGSAVPRAGSGER
jgi:hypothetical protein